MFSWRLWLCCFVTAYDTDLFSVTHKPDGQKKNDDGTVKLLTCAQEGTSEIGDFLMLKTNAKSQKIYWTYDVLFEVPPHICARSILWLPVRCRQGPDGPRPAVFRC
jgi:hypothetical protein